MKLSNCSMIRLRTLMYRFCNILLISSTLLTSSLVLAQNKAELIENEAFSLYLEDRTRATAYFRRLLQLQPYHDKARYALSLCLLYPDSSISESQFQDQLKEAIKHLNETLELNLGIDPESKSVADRAFHLGVAWWFSGDRIKAVRYFELAQSTGKSNPYTVYYQSILLEELGRKVEADSMRRKIASE